MLEVSKIRILEEAVRVVRAELSAMTRAALAAHEAATHEESRSEDKHDTRGVEASYLAGAQAERARILQETADFLSGLSVRDFRPEETIQLGALVCWKNLEGPPRMFWGFLLPKGGGTCVSFGGDAVQILGGGSPLGDALLGLHAGDAFEIETPRGAREYEVVAVR